MTLLARLLLRAAERLPWRKIIGRNGAVYLTRYTIADLGKARFRVYLNRFHRSDEDQELHNHPWRWAVSLILAGGYREERRAGLDVDAFELRPGQFNWIGADTFHRVDLLDGEAWTLFVAGPVVQSWGFWDRATDAFTPWRDFIRAKGLVPDDGWTPPGRTP